MSAEAIAVRAMAQLGTAFRLRGRTPGIALDCVGLALVAIGPVSKPAWDWSYSAIRGEYRADALTLFAKLPFRMLASEERARDGDIWLARPGVSQLHLLIGANGGWVHAHAGLRRVVFTPIWPGWPIIYRWRLSGD